MKNHRKSRNISLWKCYYLSIARIYKLNIIKFNANDIENSCLECINGKGKGRINMFQIKKNRNRVFSYVRYVFGVSELFHRKIAVKRSKYLKKLKK